MRRVSSSRSSSSFGRAPTTVGTRNSLFHRRVYYGNRQRLFNKLPWWGQIIYVLVILGVVIFLSFFY